MKLIVSIIIGSGVGDAAGMRHHSAAAPQTDSVQPGEPLDGVVDGLIVAFEPAQDGIDDRSNFVTGVHPNKERTNKGTSRFITCHCWVEDGDASTTTYRD
jgi:hypothetical protein